MVLFQKTFYTKTPLSKSLDLYISLEARLYKQCSDTGIRGTKATHWWEVKSFLLDMAKGCVFWWQLPLFFYSGCASERQYIPKMRCLWNYNTTWLFSPPSLFLELDYFNTSFHGKRQFKTQSQFDLQSLHYPKMHEIAPDILKDLFQKRHYQLLKAFNAVQDPVDRS